MRDIQDERNQEHEMTTNGADQKRDRAFVAGGVHARGSAVTGQKPDPGAKLPSGSAPVRAPLRRSLFRL